MADRALEQYSQHVVQQLQAENASLKQRLEQAEKSYNLAIASRLEWRRQAETTNRRLLETHDAYEEARRRLGKALYALKQIHDVCEDNAGPEVKHDLALRFVASVAWEIVGCNRASVSDAGKGASNG